MRGELQKNRNEFFPFLSVFPLAVWNMTGFRITKRPCSLYSRPSPVFWRWPFQWVFYRFPSRRYDPEEFRQALKVLSEFQATAIRCEAEPQKMRSQAEARERV